MIRGGVTHIAIVVLGTEACGYAPCTPLFSWPFLSVTWVLCVLNVICHVCPLCAQCDF